MNSKIWGSFGLGLLLMLIIFAARPVLGESMEGPKVVLMLGDSLTAGGHWESLSHKAKIINQGVSGDTAAQIWLRLDKAILAKPDIIFLQVGINDIAGAVPPMELIERHKKIWATVVENLPETRLFVCSLIPINKAKFGYTYSSNFNNGYIRYINDILSEEVSGNGFTFIDLYSVLAGNNEELPADLTYDGLHLNPKAYELWIEALKPYLDPLLEISID